MLAFSQRVTVMNQGEVLDGPLARSGAQRLPCSGNLHRLRHPCGHQRRISSNAWRNRAATLDKVNAFYGKSRILHDASLDVRAGEIVALPRPQRRRQIDAAEDDRRTAAPGIRHDRSMRCGNIAGMEAPEIARMGIGYVPQGRGLFAGMTVREKPVARAPGAEDRTAATAWCGARRRSSNIFRD